MLQEVKQKLFEDLEPGTSKFPLSVGDVLVIAGFFFKVHNFVPQANSMNLILITPQEAKEIQSAKRS